MAFEEGDLGRITSCPKPPKKVAGGGPEVDSKPTTPGVIDSSPFRGQLSGPGPASAPTKNFSKTPGIRDRSQG